VGSKKPENLLQTQILEWLSYQKDCFAWRNNNGAVYDPRSKTFRKPPKWCIPGVSDILGIYKGRFLAIECKVKPSKPSKNQKDFLKNVAEHGGIAIIAYELDDVQKVFGDNLFKDII